MTYYQPDPVNTFVMKWAMRLTFILSAIAIAAFVASIAIKAVMLLGSELISLFQPLTTAILGADPTIQLGLEIGMLAVFLAVGTLLYRAIVRTQMGGGVL